MKISRIILALFLISAALPLQAQEAGDRDARITNVSGTVTLRTKDDPKTVISVTGETPLSAGDMVDVSPQSNAEITLDGDTVFQVMAGSHLIIKSFSAPNTELELPQGSILAKVKPLAQPDESLTVKMPTAVVAVRGTEFAAETGDGESHIGVFDEGHVSVSGAWGREHVMLSPNQETKVTRSAVPSVPKPLTHFRSYRGRMVRLRSRAVYWHKAWQPMTIQQKHVLRQNLTQGMQSHPFRRPITPARRSVGQLHRARAQHPAIHNHPHPNASRVKKRKQIQT